MVKLPNQPTYVLILYTALSDLTIALPFIPPFAKIGATWGTCTRGLSPLWGGVWERNARASYIVAVDLIFYRAGF